MFVLPETDLKGFSCLPSVLLVTGRASELINTALGVFIAGTGGVEYFPSYSLWCMLS
jgi:hypothetical protein